jgi:hypothetical protein
MILLWDQLVLHYGSEVNAHRPRFEAAGQTTYGLLCCRFSPADYQLRASDGDHAEARLLLSETWRVHVPNALEHWDPRGSRLVVTMAINRSPCGNCANLLVAALGDLHSRFPLRSQQNRFLLASRGVYEDSSMKERTTRNDLVRLRDAGWELCVLQVGPALSDRGRILLEGLESVLDRRRGPVVPLG